MLIFPVTSLESDVPSPNWLKGDSCHFSFDHHQVLSKILCYKSVMPFPMFLGRFMCLPRFVYFISSATSACNCSGEFWCDVPSRCMCISDRSDNRRHCFSGRLILQWPFGLMGVVWREQCFCLQRLGHSTMHCALSFPCHNKRFSYIFIPSFFNNDFMQWTPYQMNQMYWLYSPSSHD